MRLISLLVFILCFYGCEDNISGPSEDPIYYDFSLSTDLEVDENGYYSMYLDEGQNLQRITAYTNQFDVPQNVQWFCDTQWSYEFSSDTFYVNIINPSSYTDSYGEANTMFGPMSDMVGDTIGIWSGYNDLIWESVYVDSLFLILKNK